MVTISRGRDHSIREITVEVRNGAHQDLIADLLNELEGVRILWHQDRAFIRHEGGKLRIDAVRPVRTVQEMRDVYTPGVARVCSAIAVSPELASRYTMSRAPWRSARTARGCSASATSDHGRRCR